MRSLCAVLCATVLASASLVACSHEENRPPPRATAPQPPPRPSVADRARSLLLAADLQLKDLQEERSHATEDSRRESLSRQIGDVSVNRDRLTADLAVEPPNSRQIARDISSLQRAMHAEGTGVTQPQPQPQVQPEPEPQQAPAPQNPPQ